MSRDVEIGFAETLQPESEKVISTEEPEKLKDEEKSKAKKKPLDDPDDYRNFLKYSKNGDVVALKDLLGRKKEDKFVDFINKQEDIRKNGSIHYAMKEGQVEILKMMMKEGKQDLKLDLKNSNKMQPLHFAARYGEDGMAVSECIDWMMKELQNRDRKYNINEKDVYGYNILHHAIQNDHCKDTTLVEKLVDMGALKVKDKDDKGNTSLHLAAKSKKPNVLEYLIRRAKTQEDLQEKKKKINDLQQCLLEETNDKKQLPIHIACQMGDFDFVKLILDFFVEDKDKKKQLLDAQDQNSERPLDLAIESGVEELVMHLVNSGAQLHKSIHTCARAGTRNLMGVILNGSSNELKVKEEEDRDLGEKYRPDEKDEGGKGKTAFFHAAEKNKADILELFKTLPLPNWERNHDQEGLGPLMVALKEGHEKTVETLLENDHTELDPEDLWEYYAQFLYESDFQGNNIFHAAMQSKYPDKMTKILLETIEKIEKDTNMKKDLVDELLTGVSGKKWNYNYFQESPFHLLAERDQQISKPVLSNIIKDLAERKLLTDCLKIRNVADETPLHVSARKGFKDFIEVFNENIVQMKEKKDSSPWISEDELKKMLKEIDEDGNTPLHLSTQMGSSGQETAILIMKIIKESVNDEIVKKNKFDKTPFSEAAASGDLVSLKKMMKYLGYEKSQKGERIRKAILNDEDLEGNTPLCTASSKGHVDIFKFLLDKKNGADITKRTSKQQTALEIAIEYNQREIIETIIECEKWEEAFREPCKNTKKKEKEWTKFHSSHGEKLDTPLRQLIRHFPDLAEKVLDKCYRVEDKSVKLNFEFIEDTFNYRKKKDEEKNKDEDKNKDKIENKQDGRNKDEVKYYNIHSDPHLVLGSDEQKKREEYMKNPDKFRPSYNLPYSDHTVQNHPLMIMATERKLNLLQHPLCLSLIKRKWSDYGAKFYTIELASYIVFLVFLTTYILSSPGPLTHPELFNCEGNFFKKYNSTHAPLITDSLFGNSVFNNVTRFCLFIMCAIRFIVMVFVTEEFKVIWNKFKYKEIKWRQLETYPISLCLDVTTTILAIYVATDQFYSSKWYEEDIKIRSCIQWNFSAFTLTAGWINLLFHMRQMFGIGKYIILFNDVIITFLSIFPVILIMIIGFGLGFHILLSNQERFSKPEHALMKTVMMFSGEFDYGDIFFSDKEGSAPFPYSTYIVFLGFFLLLSLVSINVLIGLTLCDIQKFLENADLRNLNTKIKYVLQLEESKTRKLNVKNRKKNLKQIDELNKTNDIFNSADLISKSRICEIIDNKQNEDKTRTEHEKEKNSLREFIKEQIMTVKPTKVYKNPEAVKKTKAVNVQEPDQTGTVPLNFDAVKQAIKLYGQDQAGFDNYYDDNSSYSSDTLSYIEDEPDFEDMITRQIEQIQLEVSELRQAQEEGQKKIIEDLSKLIKELFESQNGERRMEREEKNKAKKASNIYGDHLV